jgi:Fe(3+) dicitrate transport protein
MSYLAQQPGGLTDRQFEEDPRQSNRERNWFQVNWNLMALLMDYRISATTKLNTRFFGLMAGRDALGNLDRIDRPDFGGERDLLKDDFHNWGNETRLMQYYYLGQQTSVLLAGFRYYNGFTHRRQGLGSDGSDADFDFLNPDDLEGSDFDLPSENISLFAENIFNITEKFSLTPGIRFEYIKTETDGYYKNRVEDLAGNVILDEKIEENRVDQRSFVFMGLGASYKQSEDMEFYANFSQNYRAVNFNDIRVNVGNLVVDPDIDDERGYNFEIGARGKVQNRLHFDVTAFHLSYRDRIGTVLRTEPNPMFNNLVDRTIRYRTNVADAEIYGVETFVEADLLKLLVNPNSKTKLALFSNLALIDAEYTESEENGIEGNQVELVPKVNFKTGLTFSKGRFQAIYQFMRVSEQFSDATNAISTPTAIEGIIPAYQVMDLSVSYGYKRFTLETGINNLTDEHYFTRRATGYPGPGIIPSDGRSFYLTLGVDL